MWPGFLDALAWQVHDTKSRDVSQKIHAFVVIPSTVAELTMVGYLLVIGVKTSRPSVQAEERLLAKS